MRASCSNPEAHLFGDRARRRCHVATLVGHEVELCGPTRADCVAFSAWLRHVVAVTLRRD
jgi:hypothetical protein